MGVLDRRQREQGDRADRPGPEEAVGRPPRRLVAARTARRQRTAGPDQGQGGPGEDLAEQGGAVLPPGAAGEVLGPLGQAAGDVPGPEPQGRRDGGAAPGPARPAPGGPPGPVATPPTRQRSRRSVRPVAVPRQDQDHRHPHQRRPEPDPLDQGRSARARAKNAQPPGRRHCGSSTSARTRSNASRVQVTRQARSMSASASRPRRTVQAVVAWTSPASRPTVGAEPPGRQGRRPQRQQGRGDGRRAPAPRPRSPRRRAGPPARPARSAKGGFSSQGRPPIVGTRTSPRGDHLARRLRHERLVVASAAPRGPAPAPASRPPAPRSTIPAASPQASLGHCSGPP